MSARLVAGVAIGALLAGCRTCDPACVAVPVELIVRDAISGAPIRDATVELADEGMTVPGETCGAAFPGCTHRVVRVPGNSALTTPSGAYRGAVTLQARVTITHPTHQGVSYNFTVPTDGCALPATARFEVLLVPLGGAATYRIVDLPGRPACVPQDPDAAVP